MPNSPEEKVSLNKKGMKRRLGWKDMGRTSMKESPATRREGGVKIGRTRGRSTGFPGKYS